MICSGHRIRAGGQRRDDMLLFGQETAGYHRDLHGTFDLPDDIRHDPGHDLYGAGHRQLHLLFQRIQRDRIHQEGPLYRDKSLFLRLLHKIWLCADDPWSMSCRNFLS